MKMTENKGRISVLNIYFCVRMPHTCGYPMSEKGVKPPGMELYCCELDLCKYSNSLRCWVILQPQESTLIKLGTFAQNMLIWHLEIVWCFISSLKSLKSCALSSSKGHRLYDSRHSNLPHRNTFCFQSFQKLLWPCRSDY